MKASKLAFLCAAASILWGFWAANPFWDVPPTISWLVLTELLPAKAWGLLILALGLARLLVLRWGKRSWWRVLALVGIFPWTALTLASLLTNFHSTGVPAYLVIMALAILVFENAMEQ